jgi:hypothetical protein
MIATGAKLRRRLDLIARLLDGTRSPRAVIVEPLSCNEWRSDGFTRLLLILRGRFIHCAILWWRNPLR